MISSSGAGIGKRKGTEIPFTPLNRAMKSDKESARIIPRDAVTLVSNSDSQKKLRNRAAATETNAQLPAVYRRHGHAH